MFCLLGIFAKYANFFKPRKYRIKSDSVREHWTTQYNRTCICCGIDARARTTRPLTPDMCSGSGRACRPSHGLGSWPGPTCGRPAARRYVTAARQTGPAALSRCRPAGSDRPSSHIPAVREKPAGCRLLSESSISAAFFPAGHARRSAETSGSRPGCVSAAERGARAACRRPIAANRRPAERRFSAPVALSHRSQ